MERLTYFKNGHWRMKINGCQYSGEFIDRLAAYENTGLTPEEIARAKLETEAGCVKAIARTYGTDINRLRELAEADKDGRVMVLPCKRGDTVWYVTEIGIEEYKIQAFEKSFFGDSANAYGINFPFYNFGKNVFLTREEAEAKFKEKQKDGNKADM